MEKIGVFIIVTLLTGLWILTLLFLSLTSANKELLLQRKILNNSLLMSGHELERMEFIINQQDKRILEYQYEKEDLVYALDSSEESLQSCYEARKVCRDKPIYVSVAEYIANRQEYELNVYDCTEFSRDLALGLRELKIKADVIQGYYYDNGDGNCSIDNCKHDWVCLPDQDVCIEAVHGHVIPDQIYQDKYVEGR